MAQKALLWAIHPYKFTIFHYRHQHLIPFLLRQNNNLSTNRPFLSTARTHIIYNEKPNAGKWAVDCPKHADMPKGKGKYAAQADAAHCVGECSTLRWLMQRTAITRQQLCPQKSMGLHFRREKFGGQKGESRTFPGKRLYHNKESNEFSLTRGWIWLKEGVRLPRREDAFGLTRGWVWAKERLSLG